MKFKHITINVTDLERLIAFYEEVAELTVQRRIEAGPAKLAFLSDEEGDTEIELLQYPGRKYEGKGMFLCFETEELVKMHGLAEERGLKPSAIQDPGDDTCYFYVYDPDGVSVQLRVFPE